MSDIIDKYNDILALEKVTIIFILVYALMFRNDARNGVTGGIDRLAIE